jgi:anthranilate phosphoribosyltransferase
MSSTPTAQPEAAALMRSIIQRIATGPELSKDISREEARAGMRLVLEGQVDPVQAGIFLIALRMKRETDDENLGVLDAIRDLTETVTASVDEVMDIADPYDGYNRTLPSSPFLPALLAACGLPAVSHGVESVGPKYGITHCQVLRAAGAPVALTPAQAAARLADAKIGWAYVDQSKFCPTLHGLIGLRSLIVKRPAITTAETLAGPLRGRRKTHVMTGYVHKPYPRIYAMLARAAGFDSALIVRGVEGGVIPSLRQAGKLFYYRDRGEEQALELNPVELGIEQTARAVPLPGSSGEDESVERVFDAATAAKAAAEHGLAALAGATGPTRDGLVYAAALCLWQVRRHETLAQSAAAVRKMLDSGAALARFKA